MKKLKLLFLIDPQNNWIEKFVKNYKFKIKRKFSIKISKSKKLASKADLIFLMNYTRKVSPTFLIKNPKTFLVHESDLPKDKGFAPVANQVLKGSNNIKMSLIKVSKKVDCGDIYKKKTFKLNGNELSDEIRRKQAISKLKFIEEFLLEYPNVKFKKQTKGGNFNKRLRPKDSELKINYTLKKLFNKLRIVDNNNYPAFFKYKKKKYILKIYMSQND